MHPELSYEELVARAERWLAEDPEVEQRAAAQALIAAQDEAQLREAFQTPLAFGTAGLRGIVGPGPGRMNEAVICRVTAALASYLKESVEGAAERGVVVAYDGRHSSRRFADACAEVFAGSGVTCHLFEQEVPTPVGAFAVKRLNAAAGIVVTASHNPPEYNGYKVYWDTGAQIISPVDVGIAGAIAWDAPLAELPRMGAEEARAQGRIVTIPQLIEVEYLCGVEDMLRRSERAAGISVAYTAMHGVGGRFIEAALARARVDALHPVASQHAPDGDFPTVAFPNPEEPGAMDQVLALAQEKGADLAIANDPDADRFAVAAREPGGAWRALNGNEIGYLLGDWALRGDAGGETPPLVVTTLVSSGLLSALAESRGARYAETLTGFKWIAHAATAQADEARFVFGYEEALGYTLGTLVSDKDGISAASAFCEMAAALKAEGKTVFDRLAELYAECGVFVTGLHTATLPGAEGARRIQEIMAALRTDPPATLGDAPVAAVSDLQTGERRGAGGEVGALDFPRANVIVLDLEGGDRVRVRPSGTEPKIKLYFEAREPLAQGEAVDAAAARGQARLTATKQALLARLGL